MLPPLSLAGEVTHAELVSLLQAADYARLVRPDVPLALATLVAVDGSSYRQPGARMLCDAEGRVLAGAVSGGCLEGDVAHRAADVCAAGLGRVLTYDLHEDLEAIWGLAMGCEGVAHIVLAPLPNTSVLEDARAVARARGNGVLLTTVESADPGRIGQLTFVRDAAPALALMSATGARVQDTVRHTECPYLGEQLTPSGMERLLGTPVRPPARVVVIGVSRGAEAFARIALSCGWEVIVVDHRKSLLDELELADSVLRLVIAPEDARAALELGACQSDARTMFALCTHRFDQDLAWLEALMITDAPYIGILGSRQRAVRLLRTLSDAGRPLRARDRARLHSPIGLDIGGESPEEIALSAIAEMQAVLHSRPGGYLRERTTPLHARSETPLFPADIVPTVCPTPAAHHRERR